MFASATARIAFYESFADADPYDPSHLVACAYRVSGDGKISDVYWASFDSGRRAFNTAVDIL
jgi:hypothetical protein